MKYLILATTLFASLAAHSATWCTFENFNVSVAGNYVAVHGTSLGDPNVRVYVGNLTTDQGRAIHSTLLAAAAMGKPVKYGDNSTSWSCGSLPGYDPATSNPQFLEILTKD